MDIWGEHYLCFLCLDQSEVRILLRRSFIEGEPVMWLWGRDSLLTNKGPFFDDSVLEGARGRNKDVSQPQRRYSMHLSRILPVFFQSCGW